MTLARALVPGKHGANGVAGRVVLSVALGHSPFHDRRQALTHATGGFRLVVPDGRKHVQHIGGVDIRHRAFAQTGIDIGAQGRLPLCAVLCIAPGRAMQVDDRRGRSFKGRHFDLPQHLCRVAAGACNLAVGKRLLTRFRQRHQRNAAQPERPLPTPDHQPLLPTPGARRIDPEVQTVAVAVPTRRGDLAYEDRRQPLVRVLSFRLSTEGHRHYPILHPI